MTYFVEISRDNPTAILFVIDQSGSMDEKMATGKTKADFVADVLNKTIYTPVTNCTKSDGVRNYFDIGVIGYGAQGATPGLGGALAGKVVHPITALATSPLRVEDRTRLEDDGAGGVLERRVKFPVWFEPTSSGGTPISAALTKAAEALVEWCDAHPNSYDREAMEWMQQGVFDRGSFATLLGVVIDGQRSAKAFAVGDSLLALVQSGQVVRTLSYTLAEAKRSGEHRDRIYS